MLFGRDYQLAALGEKSAISDFVLLFIVFPHQFFYIVSGDITQKGYEKKRAKLLLPYLSSQKAAGISGNIYLPLQLFGSLYCFIVFC